MLRYDIVFGIILVLSIIDLALTIPVLVQEKRQAYADVVHIPGTVITKRVGGNIAKLAEEYLTTWGKPIESSETHAPSSTAPDPSCSPSMQGLGARGNCIGRQTSVNPALDHGSANSPAPSGTDDGSMNSLDASMPPTFPPLGHWEHFFPPWNEEDSVLSDVESESMAPLSEHSSELDPPSPDTPPLTKVSSDPGSPSSYSPTQTKNYPYSDPGTPLVYSPSPGAGSPKEPEHREDNPPSPGLVSPKMVASPDLGSPKELENGVDHMPLSPPPSPDPEHQLDHQSSSTNSQQDVGNAAQSELRTPA